MKDWTQKVYMPGTPVMVAVCTRKGRTRPWERGVLLSRHDSESTKRDMPRIKIHSGRVVLGCECWWIPIAEIQDRRLVRKVIVTPGRNDNEH